MQYISELRPYQTELAFCRLPAARIIGMETRPKTCDTPWRWLMPVKKV